MRSIITVTTPATSERLTTVARVQADLGITGIVDSDIEVLIDEASSRIEAELGYRLALETVTEVFRPTRLTIGATCATSILLERTPVVAIESIQQDASLVLEGAFELDPVNGVLVYLDSSGMAMPWTFSGGVIVSYSGGWVMPGENGRTLPPAIEAAAVAYVRSMYFARGNNPLVKSVDIPGVVSYEYGTGGITFITQVGALPTDVLALLAPFKRMRV